MTDAKALLELAEKVEAVTDDWETADLNADIYAALGYSVLRSSAGRRPAWRFRGHGPFGYASHWESQRRFTRSVDDALKLVPEGWHVSNFRQHWRSHRWACDLAQLPSDNQIRAYDNGGTFGVQSEGAEAATPALALTAAALRARAAQ